jgi:serine/threonine protein kinase
MILLALDYLHSKGVLHRDLTLSNIMIDNLYLPDGKIMSIIKIGDFGISKCQFEKPDHKAKDITLGSFTTPAYIAPEVLDKKEPTSKVDMWALGIILYQLLSSLKHPFDDTDVW